MATQQVETNGVLGTGPWRVDGLAKVTGRARYGADQVVPGSAPEQVAHAWMEMSPIARGRVVRIDDRCARAVPGVLEVLTYKNVGNAVRENETLLEGGYMSQSVAPLHGDRIYFAGQIVALVIADTAEAAQQGCEALEIEYEAEAASATLGSPGTDDAEAKALGETELKAGDAEAGLAKAAAVVDEWYSTPAQHHNPMELFQTTCAWNGDELTVWESTQSVRGVQHGAAQQLDVKPDRVRVLSHVVGGAFGSRGEMGQHTSLVALAARRLRRPVKLVATREQGFTLRTFRAETRHHLRLGADAQGHLTGLKHLSWELCSRKERFAVAGSDSTARLYRCPNVETKVVNVEADRQAPGFMRAPPETPYLFAMESAMDELAYKLGIDPLDMRRRNDTMVETVTGRPYTSRSLVQCIDHGAEVFGWVRRDPRPGSMREGDDLVGYGYATAFYPTQAGPAECRVTLYPEQNGRGVRARVEVGTHEIGTGARTVVAMTVADQLGLRLEDVDTSIGDSALPAVPMSAGSNSTASACSVVALACQALRRRIARRAVHAKDSPLCGLPMDSVRLVDGQAVSGDKAEPLSRAVDRAARGKAMVQHQAHTPHGGMPWFLGTKLVRKGKPILLGGSNLKDRMQFAHGAQFVEVRIDRTTGEIRVPRMVGVYAAGRIMNERTARAQLQGGQVWGMSGALHEATEIDHRSARYVNQSLAEYHIPVCADVMDIQTIMLPEVDTLVNPLGLKGVGELGVTGVNAAIANAVFHATGVRVRTLPIRVGDILPRC